jgi:hypothetical protein
VVVLHIGRSSVGLLVSRLSGNTSGSRKGLLRWTKRNHQCYFFFQSRDVDNRHINIQQMLNCSGRSEIAVLTIAVKIRFRQISCMTSATFLTKILAMQTT